MKVKMLKKDWCAIALLPISCLCRVSFSPPELILCPTDPTQLLALVSCMKCTGHTLSLPSDQFFAVLFLSEISPRALLCPLAIESVCICLISAGFQTYKTMQTILNTCRMSECIALKQHLAANDQLQIWTSQHTGDHNI